MPANRYFIIMTAIMDASVHNRFHDYLMTALEANVRNDDWDSVTVTGTPSSGGMPGDIFMTLEQDDDATPLGIESSLLETVSKAKMVYQGQTIVAQNITWAVSPSDGTIAIGYTSRVSQHEEGWATTECTISQILLVLAFPAILGLALVAFFPIG